MRIYQYKLNCEFNNFWTEQQKQTEEHILIHLFKFENKNMHMYIRILDYKAKWHGILNLIVLFTE